MPCLDYLSQVRRARPEIERLGAMVLAASGGTDGQARALMAGGTWFPCLVDPDTRLAGALGVGRIGLGWFDPIGWWTWMAALVRGARQGRITNPLQASGLAILDARAVARWVWRGQTLGDYPPLERALHRLRSLAPPALHPPPEG